MLTRPLGVVVGDFLDKPLAKGGLEFSRYTATGLLLVATVILVIALPQRAASKPNQEWSGAALSPEEDERLARQPVNISLQ